MPLSRQRAREIVQELGGWFGTPLLCRVPPERALVADDILDGATRYWSAPTTFATVPHVVFPKSYRGGLYSLDGQLLPRLLVLFGHPDRAWQHTPEHWKDSPQALESFLRVSRETALEVWAVGVAEKKRKYSARQIKGRKDHRHIEKIASLRRVVIAWAGGEDAGMADVAEILGIGL